MSIHNIVTRHTVRRFNLATEPWIPVFDTDGALSHVGLADLLHNAHRYRSLALAGDPLAEAALLRYLFTLGYVAHAADPDEASWASVAEGGPLPGVDAIVDRFADSWWLYDPDAPFFQLPELAEMAQRTPSATDTVTSLTDPFSVLVPHVPSKANAAWFNRSGDVVSSEPSPAELALGLLTRHVFASPGNEARVLVDGVMIPNTFGGAGLVGPRNVTHLVNVSSTLAATIAANLTASMLDAVSSDSVTFFEDPLRPQLHTGDALYLFSASGAVSFLPQGFPSRVLRGPLPVPKPVAKLLMETARLADPHPLRVTKRHGSVPTKLSDVTYKHVDASTSMLEWVNDLYRTGLPSKTLVCDIARRSELPYRAAPMTSVAYSLTTAGSPSGVRIASVARVTLDTSLLLPDGVEAASRLHALFQILGARTQSVSSAVYSCVVSALSDGGSTATPVALTRFASQVQHDMWALIASDVQTQVSALIGPNAPELSTVLKQLRGSWVNGITSLTSDALTPFGSSARLRSAVIKETAKLRGTLWNRLT